MTIEEKAATVCSRIVKAKREVDSLLDVLLNDEKASEGAPIERVLGDLLTAQGALGKAHQAAIMRRCLIKVEGAE